MPSIGVLTLEIHVEDAHSLKEKRHVVKSLKDKLRNRFNVALTRARRKAVVIVADPVVDVVPTDQQVLLDAMMLKEFDRYCNSGTTTFPFLADGHEVTLRVQWRGFDA